MKRLHIPIIFKDAEHIFLEYPTIPDGPQGFVLRFPRTTIGLAKLEKQLTDVTPKGGHVPSADRVLAVYQSAKVRRGPKHEPQFGEREANSILQKVGLVRKA